MISPKMALRIAENRAAPKDSFKAAWVRAEVMIAQISAGPALAALRKSAARGMSTISDKALIVMPSDNPKPGRMLGCRQELAVTATRSPRRLVKLIEGPAIGEMILLCLGPATENGVDGDQLKLGETREVLSCRGLRIARPVEVLRDDGLCSRRIEEFEIGLGCGTRSLGIDIAVDDRHRRLCQDRKRGHDDVELVGAEFLQHEEGLVFPGQEDVTLAALG